MLSRRAATRDPIAFPVLCVCYQLADAYTFSTCYHTSPGQRCGVPKMDAAIAHIEELASTAQGDSRRDLRKRLVAIVRSLETTNDTFHRLSHSHLDSAVVKIGLDLGIFKFIAGSEKSIGLETLSEKTGAEISLLGRLMRYLAIVGSVDQVSPAQFTANNITRNLTRKVAESGISHCFDMVAPIYQALPSVLQSSNYLTPTDPGNTAWQRAFNTHLHALEWMSKHPDTVARFGDYMESRDGPSRGWLDVYPVEDEILTMNNDWEEDGTQRAVFVNVGVGPAYPCAEFRKKFPNAAERVIMQDRAPVIEKFQAHPVSGVEYMAHDIFDAQPVKGAKCYFMRAVLHNFPDHLARVVLERIRDAMGADSVLILDEYVISEQWSDYFPRLISDLTMLGTFSSQERDKEQWCTLLDSVGLQLVSSYPLNEPPTSETVMEVRRKY
ncbi:S-adenosyl-L-methionine-dependent methyltransferase [Poronia punctata]|nr:S-adenosyl-L-methionine-dependent methyltransferase [Poronia punctata]